jgi:hypothetical protein
VLSDAELWEGLADARAGRVYPSKQIAADLVAAMQLAFDAVTYERDHPFS